LKEKGHLSFPQNTYGVSNLTGKGGRECISPADKKKKRLLPIARSRESNPEASIGRGKDALFAKGKGP